LGYTRGGFHTTELLLLFIIELEKLRATEYNSMAPANEVI
jgi:hypothetical protein